MVNSLTLTAAISIISGAAWLVGNIYSHISSVSAAEGNDSTSIATVVQAEKDNAQELQDIKKEIDALYQAHFGISNAK